MSSHNSKISDREVNGALLAATHHFVKDGDEYIVPSQRDSNVWYRVRLGPQPYCTCKDYRTSCTYRLCAACIGSGCRIDCNSYIRC